MCARRDLAFSCLCEFTCVSLCVRVYLCGVRVDALSPCGAQREPSLDVTDAMDQTDIDSVALAVKVCVRAHVLASACVLVLRGRIFQRRRCAGGLAGSGSAPRDARR